MSDSGASAKWFFPPLSGGEESGLNDAGIETFKDAARLAREVTQNVTDNRDPGKVGAGEPAIVTFEYLDLPVADFPGVAEFRDILESCRNHVLAQYKGKSGAGNEEKFFKAALEMLDRPTIPTLRAGDENTTGLSGADDDRERSFWRLIRGQGYSSIQGPGGGTYGIGQRAPFAHSGLRTILYSTRLPDGTRAFVGKSILASFPDPSRSREMAQNKGWWCIPEPEWRAVRGEQLIPSRFRRKEVGTDLYVVGYQRPNWEQVVRWSVLEHFFGAIYEGSLEARLMKNGLLLETINCENIEKTLLSACEEAKKQMSASEYQTRLGSTLYFFRALREPINGRPFEKRITKIGTAKLYIHRDPEAPDRWCTMRLPKILVESHGAGILRGFAGVVVCDDPDGNEYLAKLEDPAHVRWHEDEARGFSAAEKAEAREVRLEITRFVRDVLKDLRQQGQPDEQDIPDLGRYLPIDDPEGGDGVGLAANPTGGHTDIETGLITSKDGRPEVKTKLRPRSRSGPAGKIGGGERQPGGGGRKRRSKRKGGRRNRGGPGSEPILSPADVRFRSYLQPDGTYKVILESAEAAAGDALLVAVGEDSDYDVAIERASRAGEDVQVMGNRLKRLNLQPDAPLEFEVRLVSSVPLCLALGG